MIFLAHELGGDGLFGIRDRIGAWAVRHKLFPFPSACFIIGVAKDNANKGAKKNAHPYAVFTKSGFLRKEIGQRNTDQYQGDEGQDQQCDSITGASDNSLQCEHDRIPKVAEADPAVINDYMIQNYQVCPSLFEKHGAYLIGEYIYQRAETSGNGQGKKQGNAGSLFHAFKKLCAQVLACHGRNGNANGHGRQESELIDLHAYAVGSGDFSTPFVYQGKYKNPRE